MPRGLTFKLLRKAGAFTSGQLLAGEVGVNTAAKQLEFSTDGTAVEVAQGKNEKGQANGYASLGSSGVVPLAQLGGVLHTPFNPGEYYSAFANTTANTARANGLLTFSPFFVAATTTFDRIGVNITAAGAGPAKLAIYSSINGYPDALLFDEGSVDTGAIASPAEIAISRILQPGLYLLACLPLTSTTATYRCLSGQSPFMPTPPTAGGPVNGYFASSIAAFPNPAPAGLAKSGSVVQVFLRPL